MKARADSVGKSMVILRDLRSLLNQQVSLTNDTDMY